MILLLDKTKSRADTLREMLYFIGLVSVSAEGLSDAPFPPECFSAVILSDYRSSEELSEISESFGKKRIFLLGNAQNSSEDDFTALGDVAFASDIVSNIRAIQIKEGLIPTGEYISGELDASISRGGVYFRGKKISFTKTEIMILRTLIALYPRPLTQSELLLSAFRSAKIPEISNIRTHICVMNKKFQFHTAKRLISSAAYSEYSLIL